MWSRSGAGSVGAAVATAGLAVGATLAAREPLLGAGERLSTVAAVTAPRLDQALGVPAWGMAAVLLAGLLALALRAGRVAPPVGPWPPAVTGLALGSVGVLGWLGGALAGWNWGLSITGPSRSLVESVVLGVPGAAGWGTAMVLGVPVGTWLSARARGPVVWRRPPWTDLGGRAAGGVLMGVGGTVAAGCNIGNALTGLSVLAVNSAIASLAIVLGVAIAAAGMRAAAGVLTFVKEEA